MKVNFKVREKGRNIRKKIIIGIHGLLNKPPKNLLQRWWCESIREGLEHIGHADIKFNFELAYWAKYLYPEPLNPEIVDRKHPLYLNGHYVKGAGEHIPHKNRILKKKLLDKMDRHLDKIFFDDKIFLHLDEIADFLVMHLFKDLDIYYHKTCPYHSPSYLPARHVLCQDLAHLLKKHRRKEILLISHSMGTIIAYDILTHPMPLHNITRVRVHTFITLGSPLGLPVITKKILVEQGKDYRIDKKPRTPESITKKWYNLSDLNDKVAIDYALSDDFRVNSKGLGAEDFIVWNDYEYEGEKNPHAIYGYLRTPEMSELIYHFLKPERVSIFKRIVNVFRRLMKKI